MKYMLLAIFVFFASLPIEASSCTAHSSQDMSHNQHGDMMDHGQMDMDCCDHDGSDSSDNCDSLKHCGASASGMVTIDTSPVNIAHVIEREGLTGDSTRAMNRYESPPFRPPIA